MKLLEKWSRVSVGATIIIFFVASIVLYIALRLILLDQIDDDLRIEEREILIYVEKHGHLPESISVEDQIIEFRKVNAPGKRSFKTRDVTEQEKEEPEKFRQLNFFVEDQSGWHQVTVAKSLEQTNSLIRSVFGIGLVTILLILLVSIAINRWAVKRLWRPFYTALQSVKEHKLSSDTPLFLPVTQIDEFRTMNDTLLSFAGHAKLEYLSLKTFSENATHELQTPIAVIRSKLDLLQQESDLSDPGVEALQAAFNSLQRLERLNRSLLLLARIENNQFAEKGVIELKPLLEEKINEFHELFLQRDSPLELKLEAAHISMNEPLCHVLVNNLLSNALRHGKPGEDIHVTLTPYALRIGNRAPNGPLDSTVLFRRFHAVGVDARSTGLGLAIVKEICRVSGFTVSYSYEKDMHWFSICFRNDNSS